MKGVKVRKANSIDSNIVYPIYFHPAVNYYMHYNNLTKLQFSAKFKDMVKTNEIYLFTKKNILLGFGEFSQKDGDCSHVVHLNMFAVNPDYFNKGVASFMMNFFIKLAKTRKLKRMELTVEADNPTAIKFYKKMGFIKEGTLKKYYKRNNKYIDDYYMARLFN